MAERWNLPRLTLDLAETPVPVLASMLADELGVSVVAPDASDQAVTARFEDADGETAVRAIAQRLGMGVQFSEGVLRFTGEAGASDGYLVLAPGFAAPEEVVGALKGVVGGGASVAVLDGRVVVAGSSAAIAAAEAFAAELVRGPDGWLLEVRVFHVSESMRRELGLDVSVFASGSVGAEAGVGNVVGAVPVAGAGLDLLLSLEGKARDGQSWARLVNVATLYLLEGREAKLQDGTVVPIPLRAVSDQGTVTTVGFDFIETGLTIEAVGRRVPDGLLLEISPRLSAVTSFVEGAPVRVERSVSGSCVLASGQSVMLSGLEVGLDRGDWAGLAGTAGLFGGAVDRGNDRVSLLVVLTATRIYAAGN